MRELCLGAKGPREELMTLQEYARIAREDDGKVISVEAALL